MLQLPGKIRSLATTARPPLDLTDEHQLAEIERVTEQILSCTARREELRELETALIAEQAQVPLLVHLAVKLARSMAVVRDIGEPVHVSVVFAVFNEHNRIRSRQEHPHGENFLLRKIDQLNWLCRCNRLTWELIVVDDGCPHDSGRIAEAILQRERASAPVRVLFLQDAIRLQLPVAGSMTSTADSNKGGAIQYGLWEATRRAALNHIVVFTDADLSTHLGQIGLLLEPIMSERMHAAIGSRREPESVAIKKGVRNIRGKLFIYLWKRLIRRLPAIVDSQCGFKAFRAESIRAILHDLIERRFAFDLELLLRTELRQPDAIAKVPIAWFDSEAGSTTTTLEPYLPMLKAIVAMYRHYLPPDPEAEEFAALIDGLDEKSWQALVCNIPAAIADRNPREFVDFNGVRAAELMAKDKRGP